MPGNQFQQKVEPFVRCQVSVELIVGSIGLLEALKHLNHSVHDRNVASFAALRGHLLPRRGGGEGLVS